MTLRPAIFVILLIIGLMVTGAAGQELTIVHAGKTSVVVCVSPDAGTATGREWERRAAEDLAHYIGLMTGAAPKILDTPDYIEAALAQSTSPVLIVGRLALSTEPSLQTALNSVKKKNHVLRADAIVVRRAGNRVYLAGTNDLSHYHAVSWLLHRFGCRWYLPTAIGECIPDRPDLIIGDLEYAYAPPFEMRGYWLSWNGAGHGTFAQRNFMNNESVPAGHRLAKYVKDLVPEGKTPFNVAISDPKSAIHVAGLLDEQYAAGKDISLGMEDGLYQSDYPGDEKLRAGLMDKYFNKPMLTDAFMVFYNRVAHILAKKYPDSPSRIGFLAYSNITLPPQRNITAQPPLIAYLAPIDIDPNHGMDDPASPPRHEYRAMLYRWAKVMQGRLAIYDYDQGMLVWRDIPKPSHMAFRQDVLHYRKAGILGFGTESRGATATTFTNLHIRGQLMWDPDVDVDNLFKEFYRKFYGPASGPMEKFWSGVYKAWDETLVTEHEYQVAPAIYTQSLMKELAGHLTDANTAIAQLESANRKLDRNDKLYVQRMEMMRRQWAVLDGYMQMVFAASSDCDYITAAAIGRKTMSARIELARMNPTFTTRVVGIAAEPAEPGGSAAWLPGEVKQYMDLASLTNGEKGTLLKKLPVEWAFHRDPNDTGLAGDWANLPADLSYWQEHHAEYNRMSRKDYPTTQWEKLRTDIYPQGQGIRHPDSQSFTGYMWYKTGTELTADETAGKIHIMFPGIFNECWLYINGALVAHREFNTIWWLNDYKFEWDVNLAGILQAGENDITLRCYNPHHFGGMFRRPFLYTAN